MRAAVLLTISLTALLLTACGSDSGSGSTDPAKPADPSKEALICPQGGDFDTSVLVGKSEQAAEQLAEENKCTLRVTERDGKSFPMTMDYRDNRINVVVEDGKVSAVSGVG